METMMCDLRNGSNAGFPPGPAPPRDGVGGKAGGRCLALAGLLALLAAGALSAQAGQPMAGLAPESPADADGEGAVAAVIALPIPLASRPPLVDGRSLDEAWQGQPWTSVGGQLWAKACRDRTRLFLLVRFPAAEERRRHRPWRWDATAQHYLSGDAEEQALTVLWRGADGTADAWVWRADRTDAAGHADDGWFRPGDGFRPDAGSPCWESRYVAEFAGAELPRFYPQEPTGSLADVRARGIWEEGHWTVELARALETGEADDLALPGWGRLQVHPGLPTAVPEPGWERIVPRWAPGTEAGR